MRDDETRQFHHLPFHARTLTGGGYEARREALKERIRELVAS